MTRAPLTALVAAIGIAVVGTACGAAPPGTAGPAPPVVAPSAGPTPAAVAATPPSWAPAPERGAAVGPSTGQRARPPVRVTIPAIGVDSPLVDLGVDGAGALVPPERTDVVGWFAAGPVPGDVGPAVLAGHVDSRSGPGVFLRLADLPVGARIEVARSDGTVAAFTVTRRTQVAKAAFPTELVYAPTPRAELRLVTCGGRFDRAVGHYRDNIVVEAVSADGPQWTIG